MAAAVLGLAQHHSSACHFPLHKSMLLPKIDIDHAIMKRATCLKICTFVAAPGFALLLRLLKVCCHNAADVLSLEPAGDNTTKETLSVDMRHCIRTTEAVLRAAKWPQSIDCEVLFNRTGSNIESRTAVYAPIKPAHRHACTEWMAA